MNNSHLSHHPSIPRRLYTGGLTFLLLLLLAGPVQADTFTVDDAGDAGDVTHGDGNCATAGGVCTLRAAIEEAEALAGADNIVFDTGISPVVSGTTHITITTVLTITGQGADQTTISGNGNSRIFEITNTANVNIEDVTLINGRAPDGGSIGQPAGNGGAIFNDGDLTITNTTLLDNTAGNGGGGSNDGGGNGGAIFNLGSGTLTITDATLSGNRAGDGAFGWGSFGGGLFSSAGTVDISGSTIEDNNAEFGGGIWLEDGAMNVSESTLASNTASSQGGGARVNDGTLNLTASTMWDNQSTNQGGGIYINGGTVNLVNSTVSGNRSTTSAGGGIFNGSSAMLDITASTVTGNSAGLGSGGIFNQGTANLKGSILAGNTDNDCTTDVFLGTTTSEGYNVVGGGCPTNGTDDIAADPLLSDLADNGGPTQTHALMSGSPAIDRYDATTCTSDFAAFTSPVPLEDQRGELRPEDGDGDSTPACDSGAYEFQGDTPTDLDLTLTLAEGWRMLASPFEGLTYDDMIGQLWTQGFTGSDYPDGDFPNVYTWPNDQTGNNPANWAPLADQDDPIPAGTGFLIQVYADDNFDGIVEVEEDFDKTIRLDGPVLTGNVSPPMNTTLNGWTLVGNPYSDPIDFSELNSIDSGLTGVAYVFDPNYSGSDGGNTNGNPGGWRSTDGTFGELTNGIIAPAQGFFVQNSGGSGSITFTEASQTTGGQFYGKKKELRDFVRLEVQGESGVNAAWIRFSEKGSYEQMSGDALELQHYTEQYTMLGARKTDGTILDIAHFPLPDEQTEIPLSMNATQSGTYTLSATEVDLPAGTQLYLHDQGTGETILIDEGVSYSFDLDIEQAAKDSPLALTSRPTGERGHIPACGDTGVCRPMPQPVQPSGRFKRTDGLGARFLITTSKTPTTEVPQQIALGQNYPNPFNPTTVITYQLPSSSQVRLEIFDLIGRQVATLIDGIVEAGEHHVNFNAGHLTSGVYLYRLKTDSKIITRKLTLIK